MPPAKDASLVARVGFNTPRLDGEGELRFEPGDTIPADALTDKTRKELLGVGVIARADDDSPPEIPWRDGTRHVNGELVAS